MIATGTQGAGGARARDTSFSVEGYKFFCWDSENSIVGAGDNKIGVNQNGKPSRLFTKARDNPEFNQHRECEGQPSGRCHHTAALHTGQGALLQRINLERSDRGGF